MRRRTPLPVPSSLTHNAVQSGVETGFFAGDVIIMRSWQQRWRETTTLKSEVEFCESELVRIKKEADVATFLRAEQKKAYEEAKADPEDVITAIDDALQATRRCADSRGSSR